MRAADRDLAFEKQTLHTQRCARHKSARVLEHELGDVFRVKSVHVLARVERAHDRCFVNVLGRRRLNQDTVNVGIAIEFVDAPKKLCLCDRSRQLQLY